MFGLERIMPAVTTTLTKKILPDHSSTLIDLEKSSKTSSAMCSIRWLYFTTNATEIAR
tara:strand:- start:207 stop:380 length:174 start_codon:yes stop_codon:yes gene_type:complete